MHVIIAAQPAEVDSRDNKRKSVLVIFFYPCIIIRFVVGRKNMKLSVTLHWLMWVIRTERRNYANNVHILFVCLNSALRSLGFVLFHVYACVCVDCNRMDAIKISEFRSFYFGFFLRQKAYIVKSMGGLKHMYINAMTKHSLVR